MNRQAMPDRRDGSVYVMPDEVALAIEVALVTGRPLLLRGEPGSGKSSLAPYVAKQRNWRYYEEVVTSRTQPRDLLWTYDTVRRLADAQAGQLAEKHAYVEPGVLWWALASPSALLHTADPWQNTNQHRSPAGAVVLIDEIDKADPDLPNGLLVPLGSGEFVVSETGAVVRPALVQRLIVVTTNEERELPQAFLRRCVVVWLPEPDEERLVAIAKEHSERWNRADQDLARAVAAELLKARQEAISRAIRPPSIAEFLDALWACRSLEIRVGDPEWDRLRGLTLLKPQQPEH